KAAVARPGDIASAFGEGAFSPSLSSIIPVSSAPMALQREIRPKASRRTRQLRRTKLPVRSAKVSETFPVKTKGPEFASRLRDRQATSARRSGGFAAFDNRGQPRCRSFTVSNIPRGGEECPYRL